MRTVPHSLVSRRMRLDIIAGASISRSVYAAPAWMAVMSRDSAFWDALESSLRSSVFPSSRAALISDTLQVAMRGTSEEENSSSTSSWARLHLSSRISAISTSPDSRIAKISSSVLFCIDVQIILFCCLPGTYKDTKNTGSFSILTSPIE